MNLLKNAKFWLLGIAATLTVLQLQLAWRSGHKELIEPSFLCWVAVWFLVWRNRSSLRLESGTAATSVGLLLIVWVLIRSAAVVEYDAFLRFSPFVSALGLALLASGFGVRQYWRELLILGFVAIPSTSLLSTIDLSPLTAEFATSVLWYLGYPVMQQGVNIVLPTGVVEVYEGCSGSQLILQLLTLTFLFLVVFPSRLISKLLIPLIAVLIGFVVNGIRVAIMAVLFANSNRPAFDYWHIGAGSQIFSIIAVILLGVFCYFLPFETEWEIEADAEEI
ncbi:cyanoexosortase A [Phormidesmis sp. 146-33]